MKIIEFANRENPEKAADNELPPMDLHYLPPVPSCSKLTTSLKQFFKTNNIKISNVNISNMPIFLEAFAKASLIFST